MPSLSLLAVLTAIKWQDAVVLAADVLRAAVLMVLSTLGQRPQRFTGVQMQNDIWLFYISYIISKTSLYCQVLDLKHMGDIYYITGIYWSYVHLFYCCYTPVL